MKPNILLLSNAYYPSIGGIENSLRHLAQEALKQQHNVKIIVSDIGINEDSDTRFYDVVDGVDVERYPLKPIKNKLLGVLNLFYSNFILYQKLNKIYRKDPTSIVIARFHFAALMASLAGFRNIRYIVPSILKNQLAAEGAQGSLNKIKKFLRVWVNQVVQKSVLLRCRNYVFSETMLKQCVALAGNNIKDYVITKPGIDSNRFFPLSPVKKSTLKVVLNIPNNKPIILFVGRFVKAKGADLLLEAFSQLDIDCHLVMVGEGEEEVNYRRLISILKLDDKVTISPPTREVEKFYQAADIFAMTSSYEPLGQTILEALASGLLVVAFKRGESVDTATQELGMNDTIVYSEKHNAISLTTALKDASIKLKLFSRQASSSQAKSKFCWSKLYRALVRS